MEGIAKGAFLAIGQEAPLFFFPQSLVFFSLLQVLPLVFSYFPFAERRRSPLFSQQVLAI